MLPLLLAALGLQVLAALVQVRPFLGVGESNGGRVCVCVRGLGGWVGLLFFFKVFFFLRKDLLRL